MTSGKGDTGRKRDDQYEHLHPGAADYKLEPENGTLMRVLCRVAGHAWTSHRFVNDETSEPDPAFSCRICGEMRVFDFSGDFSDE